MKILESKLAGPGALISCTLNREYKQESCVEPIVHFLTASTHFQQGTYADNPCRAPCGPGTKPEKKCQIPDEAKDDARRALEATTLAPQPTPLPDFHLGDNVRAAFAALPPNWRARAQQEAGVGRRLGATTDSDDDNCIGSLEGGVSGIFEPRTGKILNLTSNSCAFSRSSRRSRRSYSISSSPSPSGRRHLSVLAAPSASLLASAYRLAGGHASKTARLRWP